ncbi:response regulator transcription factor [Aromatoleum evansii]|uniref:Response regulator transcription factor n=1 Tax=Aromatoleum evansii TaxID=59406 RepID=A0ABZ1AJN5_AROEV|nr:response regulator transcription factor [Aromatoleum evansii]
MEHAVVPCLTLAPPIKVLLVDDQRAILAGVTALIESEGPTMRVAGHAPTARHALDLARSIQPDIIVLDVDLGGEDGLDLIQRLLAGCDARIIVFTCHTAPEIRARALRLGACDVISKAASAGELLAAIRAASSIPE